MQESSFRARRVLITGAGAAEGIGFACARWLAQAGHHVALASTTARIHDRVAELHAVGDSASGHVADLTREADVARLAAEVGAIDILVNNAGMGSLGAPAPWADFVDQPMTEWFSTLDVSLGTAVRVTRAVLPGMVAAGWGRVVMMASVTGPVTSIAGNSAYAAAKAGMMGLTRTLALEVGGRGVTVNAVAPGWIATSAQTEDEARAARATPPGRAGTPDEVAACVSFLASEGASYVNGTMLVVDGGNTIQEMKDG
ncbi:SDR family oxidoreductase [Tabrizicola sp. J26]|uniref:SDR family NAD(P)-dependent oxidoreductase n=1 Tax=Alitabrizicola rongguiensis TaxID=2909234 RepID=UPI001F1C8D7A|nr:SDR family NAD(P)-dependent oxidoreductase [Tabrizicola rongguiensis]MCF1709859.1 SDR family oxidoreductase [Tabrizicola rongguiensis]